MSIGDSSSIDAWFSPNPPASTASAVGSVLTAAPSSFSSRVNGRPATGAQSTMRSTSLRSAATAAARVAPSRSPITATGAPPRVPDTSSMADAIALCQCPTIDSPAQRSTLSPAPGGAKRSTVTPAATSAATRWLRVRSAASASMPKGSQITTPERPMTSLRSWGWTSAPMHRRPVSPKYTVRTVLIAACRVRSR